MPLLLARHGAHNLPSKQEAHYLCFFAVDFAAVNFALRVQRPHTLKTPRNQQTGIPKTPTLQGYLAHKKHSPPRALQ